MNTWLLPAAALGGYLSGSVPWGLLLLRLKGGPDPRAFGSGNIGATNVARAGGKWVGFVTLLLDVGKAWLPAFVAVGATPLAGAVAGLAAVTGHCFPVWLRFAGGKGVACVLGASIALAWPAGSVAFGVAWVAVLLARRLVAVASLFATWTLPVVVALAGQPWEITAAFVACGAIVTFKHRGNLSRIVRGGEPRAALWGRNEP